MLYYEKQPNFRPLFEAAGCVCLCERKILLLRRVEDKSYPNHWGVPTGKINPNEPPIGTVIRELFEETSILLSSHNLEHIGSYYIGNDDMSFKYHLYFSQFASFPTIRLNPKEHKEFRWFYEQEALEQKLIPEVDSCITEAIQYIDLLPVQLELFPNEEKNAPKIQISTLEDKIIKDCEQLNSNFFSFSKNKKTWIVAFGPPASGKSTALKAMSKANCDIKLVHDSTILKKTSLLNFYLKKALHGNDHSFFFHFQVEVLHLRFKLAALAPNNSLVDESIFSTLAYTRALYYLGWITHYEYQTFYRHYLTYLNILPPPKAILYFDCNVNILKKRIDMRGRKVETQHSYQYLRALRKSFNDLAYELSKDFKLIEINTENLRPKEIVDLYAPNQIDCA